ncbi:MAG: prolipoprotein diacylglyceryl transferase family protein [Byssovorax sp.]
MRPWVVTFLDGLLFAGAGEALAPTYLGMLCLAMLVGAAIGLRLGRMIGVDRRRAAGALLGAWLGALLGGRLLTVLVYIPEAFASGDLFRLVTRGGFAAYGGFLGGALGAYLALGRRDFLAFGDVMSPALGFGTMLTRIGCFLAGCDYGTPTASSLGVRFPPGSLAFGAHLRLGWVGPSSPSSLPVHPTELYESLLGLVIGALSLGLFLLAPRLRGRGFLFLGAAGLYAIGRFAIEALRGDADRGILLGLSTSQIVSVLLLLAIVTYVALRGSRGGASGAPAQGDMPLP